jgi:heterogeneous nuclear ribonucleoprotein U-like protein 1
VPTYIMLIGLPGSGKSTWAQAHRAGHPEMDFQVLSSDDILDEKARQEGLDYPAAHAAFIDDAIAEMERRFAEAVRAGAHIIHDQTNLSARTRKRHLTRVPGYEKQAIVLQPGPDVLQQRFEARRQQTGKDIPHAVRIAMARRFEPPRKSEGFGRITVVRS